MGNKIFVSYKYLDSKVKDIPYKKDEGVTTARHYVDEIQKILSSSDHIYKGEDDGEDMGTLADSTIGSKLGDKIFDSSVTIVLISKGMKEFGDEKDQWIPWEISYSLSQQSRQGGKSKTNAVLAVVLPDEFGEYSYFLTRNSGCNSITYNTGSLFQILRENMFNLKTKENNIRECNGSKIYEGEHSYILSVEWHNFYSNFNHYIERAIEIRKRINEYVVVKKIS
jgi:hypothetical protein